VKKTCAGCYESKATDDRSIMLAEYPPELSSSHRSPPLGAVAADAVTALEH
jgi:hypothetical protein